MPSVWLPQINPAFLEVKLFLSGKVMDEARHAEVCVKRLWLNGRGPTPTGPAGDDALAPLAALNDYEQASLLIDILGEGQILDVFKIVYDLAPDAPTRRIVLLSRRDEARHVSYGVARLRHRHRHRARSGGRRAPDRRLDRCARRRSPTSSSSCPSSCNPRSRPSAGEVGIDGRHRAREFPGESQRFRLARLEAAGLPPRALGRLREILRRR